MTALIFLLFTFVARAEPPAELHVVSYNIKALPSLILSGTYKETRFPLIGKILATGNPAPGASPLPAPGAKGMPLTARRAEASVAGASPGSGVLVERRGADIVLLQEAFRVTDELFSGFPHRAEGPGASSIFGVNSGLYILSRYPILREERRAFGRGNCESWDCLSNKGVQFARIQVPGISHPLEVFNTHLQAGRDDRESRLRQVRILLEFFQEHHEEGNPVIFGGDFNFRPGLGQKSYLAFREATKFLHAGKYCLERGCALTKDEGWHGIWERAVDHQFYQSGAGVELVPVSVERTYREPVEGHKLSDHPAHEVRYRWVRK